MTRLQIESPQMKSMTSCTIKLDKLGFKTHFKVTHAGLLKSSLTERFYLPHEAKVVNFYLFENESNPADSSIVYAIETANGERGILIDAYGPYSNMHVINFIRQAEDIEKDID